MFIKYFQINMSLQSIESPDNELEDLASFNVLFLLHPPEKRNVIWFTTDNGKAIFLFYVHPCQIN